MAWDAHACHGSRIAARRDANSARSSPPADASPAACICGMASPEHQVGRLVTPNGAHVEKRRAGQKVGEGRLPRPRPSRGRGRVFVGRARRLKSAGKAGSLMQEGREEGQASWLPEAGERNKGTGKLDRQGGQRAQRFGAQTDTQRASASARKGEGGCQGASGPRAAMPGGRRAGPPAGRARWGAPGPAAPRRWGAGALHPRG